MPASPYTDAWLADYEARAAGWRGTGGAREGVHTADTLAYVAAAGLGNLPEIPDGSRRSVTLILAGTPVAKGRPRIARGRAYTPEKTARWEAAAKASAREQWGPEPPLDGAVRVALDVVLPVPASWSRKRRADALDLRILPQGRPDLDNYIKAAMDCLNQVAWVDDAQVVEMTARKIYGDRPRVEVRVEVV